MIVMIDFLFSQIFSTQTAIGLGIMVALTTWAAAGMVLAASLYEAITGEDFA